MLYVAKTPIGYFAFEENGKLASYKLFPKDPKKAARLLESPIPNEFTSKLKGKVKVDYRLARERWRKLAIELGFCKSEAELNAFLSDVGFELTRSRMKSAMKKDMLIVRLISIVNSLTKIENTLLSQLREFYLVHYPEVRDKGERLARLIAKYKQRENFPGYGGSVGLDFEEKELEIATDIASLSLKIASMIDEIKSRASELAREIAPNACSVVEPIIVAKLIAKAGSLEKLAKAASSTIQLLGAEKALFRHLRSKKAKPPKHGIIFECKFIRNAPKKLRGKIARAIAAKLAIAFKVDYYSSRFIGEKLKEDLLKELREIGAIR